MYNIVIFSGGTGSIAIQEGFSAIYGNRNYNLDIIINAYDNGKSTGICRKVFNSKILGPSDLRKNHMTQFKITYGDLLKDCSSREAALYQIFNLRMKYSSKEEYYENACGILEQYKPILGELDVNYFRGLLDKFFFEDICYKKWRKTLDAVDFDDFSLANIFYSAAAVNNGYSMRLAGKELAGILGIRDNVHLISDVNLYLQARTESGCCISDEEDIVEWDNKEDRIVSVMLKKEGEEYIPSVDENNDLTKVRSIKDIIESAHIIIFSSGTQWSSLIPTYMHSGLRKILNASCAKKYIVMNNVEDHDMQGVCADEIIDVLSRYISMENVTAVVNRDAVASMKHVSRIRSISGCLGLDEKKHNPIKLVGLLMRDYYELPDDAVYVYDLDGTLWDERADSYGKEIGAENLNLFSGIIHSGNNYEHVRDVFKLFYHQDEEVKIYSDFGNVFFTSEDYNPQLLTDKYHVEPMVVSELEKINLFRGKVKLRGGGCVVTIKPLVNREVLAEMVRDCLEQFDEKYSAHISGHTSIDIMHCEYNKKTMLQEIIKKNNLSYEHVIFVGNEVIQGSEEQIRELGIRTIQVNDIFECNVLLKTLNT